MIIRTSRRTFVRGAASAALTLPFLKLLERRGHAAPVAAKRLVFVVTPVATVKARFWNWGPILAPLAPLRPKISLMRIDNKAGNRQPIKDHQSDYPSLLTGFHPNGTTIWAPSIDHYIGSKQATAIKSLKVGTHPGGGGSIFASARGSSIQPEADPLAVFNQLFPSGTVGGPPPVSGDPRLERLKKHRASILSTAKEDLTAVRCQLGVEEKHKFDQHMTAIRDLETTLNSSGSGAGANAGCVQYPKPAALGPRTQSYSAGFLEVANAQIKNIVAALACDRTRVVGFQLGRANNDGIHFKDLVPGWTIGDYGHHDIAHESELMGGGSLDKVTSDDAMSLIDTWYAGRVYELLKQLNDITDVDGKTMLDNTTVVWIHEQATGHHGRLDHHLLMAGGSGGYFKMGQQFALQGQPHQRLLMSLAASMGVNFNPLMPYDDATLTPLNAEETADWAAGPLAEIRT
jgi:hypothetical protein